MSGGRWSRGTTLGVIAVVATIGTAAIASSIRDALEDEKPQRQPSAQRAPAPSFPSAQELALSRTNHLPRNEPPTVDYVIDLRTGVMTRLPQPIIDSVAMPKLGLPRFAASPDGSSLAYVGVADDGSRQIFLASADGTGVRQMTAASSDASSPAWSPDGTKVVYAAARSDLVRSLFVLDVGTGESTPVAVGRVSRWAQPTFTPDGSALIYNGGAAIRTVPLEGGKSTVLLGRRQGLEVGNGAFSPDGSLVTMMGNELDGPGAIRFVTTVDGTHKRSMGLGSSNPAGTWSPDGERIACSNFRGKLIFVVDVATGDAALVARGAAALWLDDHTLLVEV